MKKIIKIIFNSIRTLSLLILIGAMVTIFYIRNNKNARFGFLDFTDPDIIEARSLDRSHNENSSSQNYEEYSEVSNPKKLTIPLKKGTAYLYPSQIMCVTMKNGHPELLTATGQKLYPNQTLSVLFQGFEYKKNTFFKIKNAILNCNHVQQLIPKSDTYKNKNNYQYFAVMENGKEIKLSKEKISALKSILKKISF